MAKKIIASELRSKSAEELEKLLEEQKQELFNLRISKVTGQGGNVSQIRSVRRSIARIYTIVAERSREEVKKLYKNEKYIPLDLREKKSRSQRLKLSKAQLALVTRRESVRAKNFPVRKFAVKA